MRANLRERINAVAIASRHGAKLAKQDRWWKPWVVLDAPPDNILWTKRFLTKRGAAMGYLMYFPVWK